MRHAPPTVFAVMLMTGSLLAASAATASAQARRSAVADEFLLREPGGVQLLQVLKGTPLVVGAASKGGYAATIDGWIPDNALHDDTRDGFDVSVSLAAGTTIRDQPGGKPLAAARLGALFDRIEARGGWVHVRRTGWMPASAFAAPAPATPPARAPAGGATPRPVPPAVRPATTTVNAGAGLAAAPGGAVAATLESPLHASVVEHRNGWAHVQIDAWVRDGSVGDAPEPGAITAADLRADPDKYVGQTVEWTVQVLGIEKADELRPELPAGQPYLLARGPLPESGFVYIALSNADADAFRKLEPLSTVRIRATIRAGRSRFLPTPVLNFVRRLE